MKKINLLLRKCKSLSRQLARSSSYSNLRSKSTREDFWVGDHHDQEDHKSSTIIFVGSAKKRYVVSTKYLSHPLFEALLDKSSNANSRKVGDHDRNHDHHARDRGDDHDRVLVMKCEVVLFDHLLWMLENADPTSLGNNSESLEELAALYVF
uniref:Small auxin up regulated protein n=1 Tax=Boehmeria nivea TaxID=83906 RepID=A0A172J225_BOENI|nr:small auxin up regulated protein [Boehmeria nivea]